MRLYTFPHSNTTTEASYSQCPGPHTLELPKAVFILSTNGNFILTQVVVVNGQRLMIKGDPAFETHATKVSKPDNCNTKPYARARDTFVAQFRYGV